MQVGEKSMIASGQPWTCSHPILRSDVYRSLSGNQDVFSMLISCICIHRNPGEWLIIWSVRQSTQKQPGYKKVWPCSKLPVWKKLCHWACNICEPLCDFMSNRSLYFAEISSSQLHRKSLICKLKAENYSSLSSALHENFDRSLWCTADFASGEPLVG